MTQTIILKSINKELLEVGPRTTIKPLQCKYPITVIAPTGQKVKYLYEFTLYRTFVQYPVCNVFFAGTLHQGNVSLETYGLTVRKIWFEGTERKESIEQDLGVFSAQQWQVSALMSELQRTRITVDLQNPAKDTPILMPEHIVDQILLTGTARMNDQSGKWGNPFNKAAEKELIKDLKANGITFDRLINMFGINESTVGGNA